MYAMDYTTQFSEWLTAVLFQKGISQSELARQAGVTRGAINGVLTGARGPGVDPWDKDNGRWSRSSCVA